MNIGWSGFRKVKKKWQYGDAFSLALNIVDFIVDKPVHNNCD